jgi:hypothetical protein
LTTVELGVQFVSSDESISIDSLSTRNHTQSSDSKHGYIHVRENQLIRLTCVVSRARPAASLHFPFDIDYQLERNSTSQNDDQTYRTILVLILRIHRRQHQGLFYCQAIQHHNHTDDEHHSRSNTLSMDVSCKLLFDFQ